MHARVGRGWAPLLAAGAVALALAAPWGPSRARADTSGTYVGDAACRSCHPQIAQAWAETAHGKALGNPQLPDGQRGCEACHGPGSAHAGTGGKGVILRLKDGDPTTLATVCGKCHAPGGSGPAVNLDAWKFSPHAQQKGACLTCHTLHGTEQGALRSSAEKLCLSCHSSLVDSSSPEATHAPVKQGQCTLCHEPHGGTPPYALRNDVPAQCEKCHPAATGPMAAAHKNYSVAGSDCTRCHDPHSFDKEHGYLRKVTHPPFAQGNCQICHNTAPNGALRKPAPDLCLSCHPQSSILPDHDAAGKPTKAHPPVTNGMCLACHEPHASDTEAGLRGSPGAVCSTCHRSIGAQAGAATHKHPPVAKGECLSCHQGHTSAQPGLLKSAQDELCKTCHTNEMAHAHPMGPDSKDPNTGKPLTCTSCHAVHGSDFPFILPQDETKMCLTCHRMES